MVQPGVLGMTMQRKKDHDVSRFRLEPLYQDPKRVLVTAHRGFSSRYPENTMLAFRRAVELGVEIIEFDVRGTRDHIPVILHDPTLDRTTNATGSPNDYAFHELQRLNASYWQGTHDRGRRLSEPACAGETIPTLEAVLDEMKGQVGLNIQVYETNAPLLAEICRLYDEYELYEDGYLTMSTTQDARLVRQINPRIELCILAGQGRLTFEALRKLRAFGIRYIQPRRNDVTLEFCHWAQELGLYANMFYSNTDQDNRTFIGYGIQGILTDAPDVLIKTIRDLGL